MNNIISIFNRKQFMVLWILGFVIALSGFTNLNAQTKTWIGGTGNWDVPANWSPAGLPGSTSVVLIFSGDVSIPAGYTAICKSAEVNFGAKLRVLGVAELQVNGSANDGLRSYGINSEIINSGIIRVGNTTTVSWRGLSMASGGKFTNHSGALLEINRCNNQAIHLEHSTTFFDNAGTIRIGNIANIAWVGIEMKNSAAFTNQLTGVIEIDRIVSYDGIDCYGAASFNNYGIIKIGNNQTIARHGIFMASGGILNNAVGAIIEVDRSADRGLWISDVNTKLENSGTLRFGNNASSNFGQGIYAFNNCRIFNYATGLIEMNRFVSQGILVSGPSTLFTNDGVVNVGNNVAAGWDGIYINAAGAFLNNPSGNISVNKMQYNGFFMTASSSFMNKGSFKIGNLGSVNWTCVIVEDKSVFTNESGAYLECNSANSYEGISIGHAFSKFINNGLIKIGNLTNIGRHGILITSGALFQNNGTAALEINRCGSQCIYITDNTTQFQNSGNIKIGNLAPSAINGIEIQNQSTLQNYLTGSIEIDDITGYDGMAISNNANLYNYGQLKIGNIKALSWRCLSMNFGGKLFNYASGSIELNRCTNYNALEMYDAGTYFLNSGSLKIGNVAAVNWSGLGLSHQSQMDITATGILEINNTNLYDGAYIVSNAILNNSGQVKIGNILAIKASGITMSSGGKFTNQIGGLLEIDKISTENGIVIRDVNTKLTNFGNIKIGNIASIKNNCFYIHSGGLCENKSGASVEMNNTLTFNGIHLTGLNSTFMNSGSLKIGNLSNIQHYGILLELGSTFENQSGANIEIDRIIARDGLRLSNNSIFNNSGSVKIGNNHPINWYCIGLGSGSQLNNLTTGSFEINRTTFFNGIDLISANTKVTNQGIIKIGNMAQINQSCIRLSTASQFENTSTGILELNNTVLSHGIQLFGSNTKFDNYGSIKMGFTRKIHDIGILMESGSKFNNYANALIEIDSIKNRDGIRCTSTSTVFENAGTIKIGKTYPIAIHGITLSGAGCVFNNQSTGIMEVNRCDNGLNVIGAANFNNSGSIKIGNLASLQSDGIRLAGSGLSAFTNQINGVVEIDNVANLFAVDPGSGTIVSNYGTLKIGFNSPVFHGIGTSFGAAGSFFNYGLLELKNILNNGIHSNQTVNNNAGATISIPLTGKLQIANLGILNNGAGAFVHNFGTVTNNGVINNSGTFNNQSIYKGTGVFNTSLFNNPVAGTVAPGLSPGCLQFTNGWASVGKLEIEINGPVSCSDFDQIQVTGNAQAGGNLYIYFNYTPACGATFQLINATTHSGSFANIFITPNTITASYSNGILSILDVIAPSIICPSNVEYTTAPGDCGPVPSSEINLGSPVTSDNCGVSGTSNNAPSTYALGVKNVKWTVTDLSGNTNTCIQKVTIKAGTCGTPQQVYSTDVTQTSAKVKWNAGVPCATDYQLRLRYEISPGVWSSWSTWSNHSGPGLEHLFTGLSPNRYYHYQIRSKCGSATNSNSINGWFTTLPSGGSLKRIDNAKDKSYTDPDLFNNGSQRNISDLTLISVSPNPAKDWIILSISGFNLDEKQMSIIDLSGKLISSAKLQASENELEIDLLNLPSGIYYLRVSNATKQKTIQFVMEK